VQELLTLDKRADECLGDLFTYRVAAASDTWTHNAHLVGRIRVEDAAELANRFLDDPGQGAAPAGMDRRNQAALRIDDQHRKAVCDSDCQQDPGVGCQQCIARRALPRPVLLALSGFG
jgi:hypothetical protein